MATVYNIYQGDTGPIMKPRPSVLDDGVTLDADWHCYINVIDSSGTEVVPKREVTDKTADNLRWIAALLPAETATIPVSNDFHTMVIEVVNATTIPPFNVEKHYSIAVHKQGIV